ncbi:metallophosphoesterase [Brevibacterium sp.]|uniref:metallophosphoesterase n=1 Tax=Brevibacterium sp. TaxID=1701 RepID=UPI0028118EEE|nr:metallophosphoesterase family protein [Brevibacterium sp.]
MPTTYFTSDTHLHHRLMVILRGFVPEDTTKDQVTEDDLARHDESIIEAWNASVRPEDTVWHLGDLTLQRPSAIAHLIARLNGDIRLVLGNHDRAHPLFGSKSVPAHTELLEAGISYATMAARVTLRESDHNRIPVVLSHFPYAGDHTFEDRFEQWRLRDVGEILLHGHTHSDQVLTDAGNRQIHVGWDAWGRPVSEDEIVELIRSQGIAQSPPRDEDPHAHLGEDEAQRETMSRTAAMTTPEPKNVTEV